MPCYLSFLSLIVSSSATTWYISPIGNDQSTGTSPTTPYLSLSPLPSHYSCGDSVLFDSSNGPHTFHGTGLYIPSVIGDPCTQPMVVSSYSPNPGGGGALATLHFDVTTDAILLQDTGSVAVSQLSLLNVNAGPTPPQHMGIHVFASSGQDTQPPFQGVAVSNAHVSGFFNGISIDAAGCRGYTGLTVTNSSATGSWGSGISSTGDYSALCYPHTGMVIADCFADYNQGDPSNKQSWSGSGIVLSGVDGGLITRCSASFNGHSNGHDGGGPVGIWFWNSNNGTISHCVARGNGNGHAPFTSNDGGGFDLDGGCSNCVIEYCLSYNNTGPGFLVCSFGGPMPTLNNTVRYSVSLGDGTGSSNGVTGVNFFTPDTLAGTTVVGNTLVTSSSLPLLGPTPFGAPSEGLVVGRNAFLSLPPPTSPTGLLVSFPLSQLPSRVAFSGNQYWAVDVEDWAVMWGGNKYTSLAAWKNATHQEMGGTQADPGVQPSFFFSSCVPWWPEPIAIPNSPSLDALRGFSGC